LQLKAKLSSGFQAKLAQIKHKHHPTLWLQTVTYLKCRIHIICSELTETATSQLF